MDVHFLYLMILPHESKKKCLSLKVHCTSAEFYTHTEEWIGLQCLTTGEGVVG